MSAPAQRAFSGGELSPSLYARTDQLKYATGARTLRNVFVMPHGGAANRAGLKYLNGAKSDAVACRLIPFVLDATDVTKTYMLELGDGYLRCYQNGARVATSGTAAWADATVYTVGDLVLYSDVVYYCIVAHTSVTATDRPSTGTNWQSKWYAQTAITATTSIYEIPTPYVTADLPDLQFKQSGEVIKLTHQSHPIRELRRSTSTRWVLVDSVLGPSIGKPGSVNATGGGAGAQTYYAVTAVKEGTLEESLPGLFNAINIVPSSGAPTTVTWTQVEDAKNYRVYRGTDGKTYGLIQGSGGITVARSDTAWGDTNEVASSADSTQYVAAAGQLRNALAAISATQRAYDGKYTVKFVWTLASGAASSAITRGRIALYFLRSTDSVRQLAGYFYTDLVTGPSASWGPVAETVVIDVPDDGYTTLQIDLVPEVRASAGGSTCTLTIDSSGAPNDSVTWTENSTAFADVGAAPDYSQQPPTQQALFSAVGKYPAAVGTYQQRDFFANTVDEPEQVWGSRIASRNSFTKSTPLRDDDVVQFALAGNRTNIVKHLLDLAKLIVFTTQAAFVLEGDEAGTLTPDQVNPKKVSNHGIGRLRPLEVDEEVMYVQARGVSVRSLVPVEAGGMYGGYRGTNLSIFAEHLFQGFTIVDWAYAEEPYGIVWVVRSDGKLLGLTFLREHGIWAWHWHETDGTVENVCVVPEGSEDAVYLCVKRTINGTTKRYIERMHSRVFFDAADPKAPTAGPFVDELVLMDCSLTVDGWHTGVVTMTLSGGSAWNNTEQLTLTASASFFAAADVTNGAYIYLIGATGTLIRCAIEAYTSATVVTVRPDRLVPTGMRSVAIGNGSGEWGKAIKVVTGLTHLEAKTVSVFADGFVMASPNNAAYTALTVASGQITLPHVAVRIHVGLPYISDIIPLDIDTVGGRTIKDKESLVNGAVVFVEKSRGIWFGSDAKPTVANPLLGLTEHKPRQNETYDTPPALVTDDYKQRFDNGWRTNGRFLIRQVDPVPMTILSLAPIGFNLPG